MIYVSLDAMHVVYKHNRHPEVCSEHTQPEAKSPEMAAPDVGNGNDLSNFPAKIQISYQNSNFPAKI